jgi:hypothetical protein
MITFKSEDIDTQTAPQNNYGRVLFYLTMVIVAFSAAFKTRGNDVWWHIRSGQWIFENQAIPTADPFSHTALGNSWVYTDWLSQLVFFGLDQAGGAGLLVFFKVLVVGVIAFILFKSSKASLASSAMAVCLAAIAMNFRLVLKPEIFSLLGFVFSYYILLTVDRGGAKKSLWLLALLSLVWGNFHRGGTICLVLMFLAMLSWVIIKERRRLLPVIALVGILSLLALMINPGGFYYITSAFRLSSSETLGQGVQEWASLSLALPWLSIPYFLIMAGVWIAGRLFELIAERKVILFQLLVVLALGVMAFKAVRFIPFAAMAMVPLVAKDIDRIIRLVQKKTGPMVRANLVALIFVVISWGLVGHSYLVSYSPAVRGLGAAKWLLPVEVAEFLKKNLPPGKMYNPLNLSGYLLYRLSPEKKVFVDGRADTVYSKRFFEEALLVNARPEYLLGLLDKYRIDFAVVETGNQTSPIFSEPGWVLVYWDDRTAVLVRDSHQNKGYLSEYGYHELKVGSTIARLMGNTEDPSFRVLAKEIFVNLQRAPGSIRAHYLAALVFRNQNNQKRYNQEMKIVEQLAKMRDIEFDLQTER